MVFLAPLLNLLLHIRQRQEELVHVQVLIAEAAIKRFNVQIFGRFTKPREVECDVLVVGPSVERFADKLAAIIHLNTLRRHA
jgi:hypothetical protein